MTTLLIIAVLLTVAIGPALFWLLYFYQKDKYEPEPLSWIVKIFLLGALITIPIAVVEGIAGFFISQFALIVIAAPVIEECGKFFIVKKYAYTTSVFNEPVDGIIYAVAAALGFATIENIRYVFFTVPLDDLSGIFFLVVIRALLSVPGHALFTSISGYSLGIAKYGTPQHAQIIIIAGLVSAIVFHAVFNYFLMGLVSFALLLLVVIPFLWWLVHRNLRNALDRSGFK